MESTGAQGKCVGCGGNVDVPRVVELAYSYMLQVCVYYEDEAIFLLRVVAWCAGWKAVWSSVDDMTVLNTGQEVVGCVKRVDEVSCGCACSFED